MPSSTEEEDAQVKAQILSRYPDESEDLVLSPLCDTSHGEVDGEAVVFSYRVERRDYHYTGQSLDCLSWEKHTGNGNGDITVVAVKHIVGIHTVGGRLSSEYSLIYIDTLPDSPNTEPLNMVLRITTLVNPPDDLLSDFSCPEEPEHLSVQPTETTPNLHIILPADEVSIAKAWTGILQLLLDHFQLALDEDYSLHHQNSDNFISELVTSTLLSRATHGIAQTIILIGNDQGVGDILNALLSTAPVAGSPAGVLTAANPSIGTADYVKPVLAILPWVGNNAIAHSNHITSEGWSNRITKHSTLGLRALLRGQPSPLPFFRATFSHGARLQANRDQDDAPPRHLAREAVQSHTTPRAEETTSVLHGAVIASWGLHPYSIRVRASNLHQSSTSGTSATTTDTTPTLRSDKVPPCHVRGQVTMFDASENITLRDGNTMSGKSHEVLEVQRREHACVMATCCEFLDEDFVVSPEHRWGGSDLKVLELGPLDTLEKSGQDQPDGNSDTVERRPAPPVAVDEARGILQDVIQGSCGSKLRRDRRVGYYDVQGVRIELDPEENDERQRQFCIDGNIVVVEKGGWMEVQAARCGIEGEGALDLIAHEWEGSEFSVGELGNVY